MAKQVAATDYVAAKSASEGLPITAEWRDGNVSIGGMLVKPTKVVDGKAYVNDTDIDQAVSALKKQTGVKTNQEIFDTYLNRDNYKQQMDKLTNREEFNYNPEQDEVYQAYKKQYNREGARQTEDTVGVYSALTGGMANSSAVTAAAQAGQYWNEKLMDVIPELASDAYDRYVKEFEMDRQALADILDVDTTLFDRAYAANRDTISDITTASQNAAERDRYNEQRNIAAEKEAYDRYMKEDQTAYDRNKDRIDRDDRLAESNRNYELDKLKYQDNHDQWMAELQAEAAQNTWSNALKLYEAVGEVPNEVVASILGIPAGTVTSEMKQLVTKLAHEKELAAQKHTQDMELQQLKGGQQMGLQQLKGSQQVKLQNIKGSQQSSLQSMKNENSIDLQKLKHLNTLSEIEARKTK